MFLQFQKVTNTAVATDIIVNAQELLALDPLTGLTSVEIGNPKHQFYTPSTISAIEAALNVIDISVGYVPGSPCSGGNSASIIAPSSSFPLIRIQVIVNNTLTQTREVILNPSKILYIEPLSFIDSLTSYQVTGVMIIMTDSNRTRYVTTLTYDEVFQILLPTIVA